MNIDVFINARKKKNLSQSELAEGICTQVTLSRFENNGQIPKLSILMELCQRLDISPGDLFPKVSVQVSKEIAVMDEVEFYLITSEIDKSIALMHEIDTSLLTDPEWITRYHYLNGYIKIEKQDSLGDILFEFDQVLFNDGQFIEPIYKLLSYTGIGMAYAKEGSYDKSEFYFHKVLSQIYSIPIRNIYDIWRVLNIVFQTAVYYSNQNDLEIGNTLLEYVFNICQDNHVTYYLARAMYQYALNAITTKSDVETVLEYINDGRAYAKINRNKILLKRFDQLKEEIRYGSETS